MSLDQAIESPQATESADQPVVTEPRTGRTSIRWMIAAVFLLASSGVVRGLQDRRFETERSYLATCPFPLKSISSELDGWKVIEGDKSLDPLTTRTAGATDHVIRTYVDELTGVTLTVLILFGPAEPVLPHSPQVCYPSCGYTATEEPTYRVIKGQGNKDYVFRSGVFAKSGGRSVLREVVYHSFRLEGPWTPDLGSGRRFPRKNPGIFKVQVQRRVAEGERRDKDDPIEHFLALLIPEIDRRIEASQPTPTTPTKPGEAPTTTASR